MGNYSLFCLISNVCYLFVYLVYLLDSCLFPFVYFFIYLCIFEYVVYLSFFFCLLCNEVTAVTECVVQFSTFVLLFQLPNSLIFETDDVMTVM